MGSIEEAVNSIGQTVRHKTPRSAEYFADHHQRWLEPGQAANAPVVPFENWIVQQVRRGERRKAAIVPAPLTGSLTHAQG